MTVFDNGFISFFFSDHRLDAVQCKLVPFADGKGAAKPPMG